MRSQEILLDAFGRVHELVPAILSGLTVEDVLWRPDPAANSIGWLIWHLARVEDDHLAGVADREQVWTARGWAGLFGLPYPERAVGFGQTADDVAAFTVAEPGLLRDYYDDVHAQTVDVVTALTEAGFDAIVDRRWTPPVTAAVRLVSVLNDVTQHVGQAGYVRGLRQRAAGRADDGWAGYA